MSAMKISVVIPTFNYGHYLPAAIESVLRQTRPPDEIVVVDDGSTDDTKQVVARYEPQVRYFYQPNAGLSAARNTGTRLAAGDWTAYLDSDDAWEPEKLRKQENAIRNMPGALVAYTGFRYLYSDGTFSKCEPATSPERLWPALRARNLLPASSVMAHRESVIKAGGFNETLRSCEDWDLWVRLRLRGPFAAAPECLTTVRVTPQSMSSNAQRMIDNMEAILDGTLLQGLSGLSRVAWTRRIRSVAELHAAITVGAFSRSQERERLIKSLLLWPSPFYESRRYLILLRNLLGPEAYKRLSRLFSGTA